MEFVASSLGVPAATAIDVVGRLAARSLVVVDHDNNTDQRRHRLLESIKAFAQEQLNADGTADLVHRAHVRWYADGADVSTEGVRGGEQREYLALAQTERANIDAALAWCRTNDPTMMLRIALGFGWAWVVLGDTRGAERLRAALAAAGPLATAQQRVHALLLIGWIEASTGHLELARTLINEATDNAQRSATGNSRRGAPTAPTSCRTTATSNSGSR